MAKEEEKPDRADNSAEEVGTVTSEVVKRHKKSGYGVPIPHTCKNGDMRSTEICLACIWLRDKSYEEVSE